MIFRVGITGGIGSGKSTVADIFSVLGMPVYRSDDAARRLMNDNEDLKSALIRHFGEASYTAGQLNRAFIASQVFDQPDKLELLNSIVHPVTIRDAEQWMHAQTTPYAIKEAAIIFETGSQRWLDFIIGVHAPVSLRIQRIMQRSQMSREEVLARMDRQMDDAIKMKLCDLVVSNDEQHALLPQVMAAHERLLKLAAAQQRKSIDQ